MPTGLVWMLVGLAVFLIVLFGAIGYIYVVLSKKVRDPQIKGPALIGTGRVLSIEQTALGRNVGTIEHYGCRIALSVQLPGRAPYDVTIVQYLNLTQIPAVQPGNTLAVKVDSTNPQVVLIDSDSSQPATNQPAGSGAPPTLAQMAASGSPATVAQMAEAFKQNPGAVPTTSGAALLASGQRVPGVLKSFVATGATPRSLGQTPSRPELIDAPLYVFEVELQFPNMAPVDGRNTQLVPPAQLPNLAIGLPLTCAVDPANPSLRFVVDWDVVTH
jgi:hypothetical protein